MLKPAILTLAAMALFCGAASAGDRYGDRYAAPPPPVPGAARYYGPVNNYYGPVTVYAAPDGGSYAAPSYPAASYGGSYSYGYATAPECDANCYGAGYDWSHGYGYGTAYPAYGTGGGSSYPSSQRMNPWAGYNGGFGNGYW